MSIRSQSPMDIPTLSRYHISPVTTVRDVNAPKTSGLSRNKGQHVPR